MIKFWFIGRQIRASGYQGVIFILCVALSMVTLVSLGSFSRSVHSSLLRDARILHAADLIARARSPFPLVFLEAVAALKKTDAIETARIHEFHSVVRTLAGDRSLLSLLKVVEPGYPFYGRVELASGRPFKEVLAPGKLVVEGGLLERLGLKVGDRLRVGAAVLVIADVVIEEPDRPLDIFSLGPRVFVAAADLETLALVGVGSRVRHTLLARVREPQQLAEIVRTLRLAASDERLRVESFQNADSRAKRFFDHLLFFLRLIGVFTLLLAGIGIQSTLSALLREQEKTIGIMKAMGATSRFILRHYFGVVLALGTAGTLLGLAGSFVLQRYLPNLFLGLLPKDIEVLVSSAAAGEGLLVGLATAMLFTAFPLYSLREVKPRAIFGKETRKRCVSRPAWLLGSTLILSLFLMLFLRLERLKTGFYFLLGLGSLMLATVVLSSGILFLARTYSPKNLVLRQALKGLFRPRNATRTVIVTLSAALAVIFSIPLIEKNLDEFFVQSFPEKTPNLFFIDIQPGQKEDFIRELGVPVFCHPVVRGSVLAIKGDKIDPDRERRKKGDNLGREFNLTYRETLLPNERLVAGRTLFRADWSGIQVSVLDRVTEMRGLAVGDRITFRIQGIPLEARVASIRTRIEKGLQPFFYFVFPEKVLGGAPQTFFAAARFDKEHIPALQNRIVGRFPNISIIDVTEAITAFARIMAKLSSIVRFFSLFALAAGVLMVISSLFATRYARIRETVYYKILGARRGFVLAVFVAESLIIGLISSLLGLVLAQAGSWLIFRQGFDLSYRPFIGTSVLMAVAATALVVAVGGGASVSILGHKPGAFLREQADD